MIFSKAVEIIPFALFFRGHQRIHKMQVSKGVFTVNYLPVVHILAVLMYKLRRQRRPTQNYGHINAMLIKSRQVVLHKGSGFYQQTAHRNAVCIVFLIGRDDIIHRLLNADVDHLIAVVREDNIDQVFTNVMHIALDRGDDDRTLAAVVRIRSFSIKGSR